MVIIRGNNETESTQPLLVGINKDTGLCEPQMDKPVDHFTTYLTSDILLMNNSVSLLLYVINYSWSTKVIMFTSHFLNKIPVNTLDRGVYKVATINMVTIDMNSPGSGLEMDFPDTLLEAAYY